MNRRRIILCALTLALILKAPSAMAGAWAQKKGHYYAKLTFIYYDATFRYDSDGFLVAAPYSDIATYFYLEYGLFNRTTVITSFPLMKRSRVTNPTFEGKTNGFMAGDFELYVKQQLTSGPIIISGLVGTKIPFLYKNQDLPPLGTGVQDYDMKLLLGTSLYPIPVYATLDLGYRYRSKQYEDEFNFSFEVGYLVRDSYIMRVFGNGIRSMGEPAPQSEILQFAYAQDQTRLGGGIIFRLSPNLEVDLSYVRTVSGRNIPQAGEIYFGVALKK